MHFGTGLVLTCRNQMHCSTACWAMQYLLHKYTTQAEDQSIHCWRYLTLLFVLSHSSSTCKHLTMQLIPSSYPKLLQVSFLSIVYILPKLDLVQFLSRTVLVLWCKNDQKMVRQELYSCHSSILSLFQVATHAVRFSLTAFIPFQPFLSDCVSYISSPKRVLGSSFA